MEPEKETFNIMVISVQIKQLQEQLELGKRLAEYCGCWLGEAGTGDDVETAEKDLSMIQDNISSIEQKIKELETEKSLILQKMESEKEK